MHVLFQTEHRTVNGMFSAFPLSKKLIRLASSSAHTRYRSIFGCLSFAETLYPCDATIHQAERFCACSFFNFIDWDSTIFFSLLHLQKRSVSSAARKDQKHLLLTVSDRRPFRLKYSLGGCDISTSQKLPPLTLCHPYSSIVLKVVLITLLTIIVYVENIHKLVELCPLWTLSKLMFIKSF